MMNEFDKIYNSFFSWLMGIVEDDPLEYEINFYWFVYNFKNNMCEVGFAGNERPSKKAINFDYYPLEAQFFFDQNIIKIVGQSNIKTLLKTLVYAFICDPKSNEMFKNKKVYISKIYSAPFCVINCK